jgi:hypothetical protein
VGRDAGVFKTRDGRWERDAGLLKIETCPVGRDAGVLKTRDTRW